MCARCGQLYSKALTKLLLSANTNLLVVMLAKDLAMGTDDGPDAQPADESRLGKLVRLLALMRIALFLTFVLFWLALLSGSISMFQNLFEEQMGFWGATLVSITAFMAGWLAMALVFIVIELGPHRFDFPNVKVPVWFSKWRFAIFAIPAVAIIGRLWRASRPACATSRVGRAHLP